MHSDLSEKFRRVKEAEPNGSNPQSKGKVCCHLGSGRYEEMK